MAQQAAAKPKPLWKGCGKISAAAILSIIANILVIIALATPNWLATDRNRIPRPIPIYNIPFDKIGLWQFCFRLYEIGDPFLHYSSVCQWYDAKFPILSFSMPVFFTVTQVIYTAGCVLSISGMILLIAVIFRGPTKRSLFALGGLFVAAAIFICISCGIFAARVFVDETFEFGRLADFLSYSFAMAVAGGILLLICGPPFLIEGHRTVPYSNKQ